jgi:putative ABC transport system ATP-binding protein
MLDTIAADTGAALITITHDLAVASRARRHLRLGDGVLTAIEIAPRSGGTLESLVGSDVVVPAAALGATAAVPLVSDVAGAEVAP